MNKRFTEYLSSLTPKKRDLAQEAVMEYLKGEGDSIEKITTATAVYNVCADMAMLDVEHFDILICNQSYKMIKRVNISQGGWTEVSVDIRIIMKECILNNGTILFCVHNHPSGRVAPSRIDDQLTMNIKKACEIMRIYFADHVIIGDGQYYSYREQGQL